MSVVFDERGVDGSGGWRQLVRGGGARCGLPLGDREGYEWAFSGYQNARFRPQEGAVQVLEAREVCGDGTRAGRRV